MRRWEEAVIGETATLREAIAAIDNAGYQIALVVNAACKLLGTVSDGDVRRAILRGVALDAAVAGIMRRDPITATEGRITEAVLSGARKRDIWQIPLLDDAGRLVGLGVIDELAAADHADTPVVLMAGGLGSRLRPLTEDTPKPLLKVGDKPILETILETIKRHGFRNFHISIGYKADAIREYFGDGKRWGVSVRYIVEPKPLGTAGALGLMAEVPASPLLVMNADLLTNVNYGHLLAYHREQACRATVCVNEYAATVPYGVVEIADNRVTAMAEKPVQRHFINAGIYVLEPDVVRLVRKGEPLDMPGLLRRVTDRGGEVAAFPIREFWLDIGQHEDYAAANGHYERMFK
jgi:dTDP-glucose pyrophosphorylase